MEETDYPYLPVSKAKISLVSSLESKKFRIKERLFAVQGTKSVEDALKSLEPAFVCATQQLIDSKSLSGCIQSDKLYVATDTQMRRMSSLKTAPDVIAVFPLPEESTDTPVLDSDKLYIIVDGIQDPGNLGTVMRTADWFGIEDIFCSPDSVDIYNPKSIMAAMGSFTRTRVKYIDPEKLIAANPDLPVYGTLLDGENIYETSLTPGGLIALGNEGNGLTEKVKRLVTHRVKIPPYNKDRHAESLNVGAAAAVTVSEFRRRFPLGNTSTKK